MAPPVRGAAAVAPGRREAEVVMRGLVSVLLIAALVWWFWGGASGAADAAMRSGADAAPPASTSQVPLEGLREGATPVIATPVANPLAATEQPRESALPNNQELPSLDDLLPRLAQREPAAIAQGWALLATTGGSSSGGSERHRLTKALLPNGEDFPQLFAALGPDNAFLHSAEGRGVASKAVASAMALADAQAVPAGTQLLTLMLRGRITKADEVARAFVDDAYKQHRVRVDRWLCDPGNVTGARSHTVARGDSLARIAQRFRKEGLAVEDGTIAVLNRIHNPNALQIGQKVKIPVSPITGVLEKRSFGFAIYVGEHLLRLYWVGHGANDHTPLVEFTVGEKQAQPAWTSPDGQVYPYGHPKNILGEYFIKFLHDTYTGFGAHGTTLPGTICTMSSAGCIRMLDADIAELFKILPRGAKVVVRATESIR